MYVWLSLFPLPHTTQVHLDGNRHITSLIILIISMLLAVSVMWSCNVHNNLCYVVLQCTQQSLLCVLVMYTTISVMWSCNVHNNLCYVVLQCTQQSLLCGLVMYTTISVHGVHMYVYIWRLDRHWLTSLYGSLIASKDINSNYMHIMSEKLCAHNY